jgi:hypothetical protein
VRHGAKGWGCKYGVVGGFGVDVVLDGVIGTLRVWMRDKAVAAGRARWMGGMGGKAGALWQK